MAEEKQWLLLIHYFDEQEKFIRARVIEVSATIDGLRQLTLTLSEFHKPGSWSRMSEYFGKMDCWTILREMISATHQLQVKTHTIRVMSILPAE